MATITEIQEAVCAEYGANMKDFLSDRKARGIARPRQVAMYLCVVYTPNSSDTIGIAFGRDHTTILAGRDTIIGQLKRDPILNARITRLVEKLGLDGNIGEDERRASAEAKYAARITANAFASAISKMATDDPAGFLERIYKAFLPLQDEKNGV